MAHDVRWGILGTGNIAAQFVADITRAERTRAFAVGSRDPARAEAFARRHSIPRAYGSYEDLSSDTDVDIVYVATPHMFHYEHAMLALEHDKSVLVEKPFVMSAWQAESLVAEARRRGVLLMDGLWTLCNPLVIDLARRVRGGAIGTPRAFIANVGPLGVPFPRGTGMRLEDPTLGASFVLECHVYPLAIMLALAPRLGDVETVSAAATFTDQHVDEIAAVILQTPSGEISSISGGFAFESSGSASSRAQLIGTSGWLEISDDLFNPSRAVIGSATGLETVTSDAAQRGFVWEIEEASRAFRRGLHESEHVPLSLTLDVMRLTDRIRVAAGITVGD